MHLVHPNSLGWVCMCTPVVDLPPAANYIKLSLVVNYLVIIGVRLANFGNWVLISYT